MIESVQEMDKGRPTSNLRVMFLDFFVILICCWLFYVSSLFVTTCWQIYYYFL